MIISGRGKITVLKSKHTCIYEETIRLSVFTVVSRDIEASHILISTKLENLDDARRYSLLQQH